jgi:hypothetical protein
VTSPPSDAPRGGRRGAHRAPRSTARRLAYAAVLLVVLAVGALLLVRPWARSDAPAEPDTALTGVAPDVVQWLDEELPADTPVTAADDVRAALAAAGAGHRVGTTDAGALQVVSGEPPDGGLVVARFEAADGTALSVVDPDPGRPTAEELDRRQRLAAAVLANPVAGATGRSADVLRNGDIDARLLGLLAGLVARMDVHVADLPPAPGQPSDGTAARRVLVDQAAGEPLTPGAAATQELVAFLEAQRPPFAADVVEQTDDGVLVGFDYVSAPDAVVSAET